MLFNLEKRMNIGKFKITSIETGRFGLDGGAMFGVIPKALWQRAYDQGDDKNRIPLTARLLVVEWDNKKMLIDTGIGTKNDQKFAKIYDLEEGKIDVEWALENNGFKASDITDVILTHLHFDHVGGATKFENGELVPTFPNAKYHVQKEQFKWGMKPSIKDKASYMSDNYLPLEREGLLELVDGTGDLFPGIKLITTDGHTKGMQLVEIEDADKSLLYVGDLAPTTAHLPYAYGMGYDNEPLKTIEEKRQYFARAADKNSIIFFEHDVFTVAAKIEAEKHGFVIKEKIKF
jgi:glyoxylase-like metal-dependent hydrolase (beta-lactamase superfamily II)